MPRRRFIGFHEKVRAQLTFDEPRVCRHQSHRVWHLAVPLRFERHELCIVEHSPAFHYSSLPGEGAKSENLQRLLVCPNRHSFFQKRIDRLSRVSRTRNERLLPVFQRHGGIQRGRVDTPVQPILG